MRIPIDFPLSPIIGMDISILFHGLFHMDAVPQECGTSYGRILYKYGVFAKQTRCLGVFSKEGYSIDYRSSTTHFSTVRVSEEKFTPIR